MRIKKVIFFCFVLELSGCAVEQNYRGVPEPVWQHLTAEQKQLIVDQSFAKEMKKIEVDKK